MLAEFDKAFAEFERDTYSLLHESHFDAGTNLASFKVQIQAQSLATDIGYLSMVMRDLHEAAIREVSDEADHRNAEYQAYFEQRRKEAGSSLILDDKFFRDQPRREYKTLIAHAKLWAAFKAFLFPIRGYQDAIYKVGLCVVGQKVGGKSGMTRAVDVANRKFYSENPIAKMLESSIAEYPEWFASLRGHRDFIKYGASISYSSGKNFDTGETTVAMKLHTSSENQPSMSLDDVSRALRMSAKATLVIINAGIDNGTLITHAPI